MSQAHCTHCFAPITNAFASHQNQFCCTGCAVAYQFISHCNLDAYYHLKQSGLDHPPAWMANTRFVELDDPELIRQATQADGARRFTFFVEGVHCAACIWVLERLPSLIPGVISTRLTLATQTLVVIAIDPTKPSQIAQTIGYMGYRPRYLQPGQSSQDWVAQTNRRDLIRVGIAFALNSNIMLMTVPLYGGAMARWQDGFTAISATLCLIVVTYCAWPFYRSAWGAVRSRSINLDTPIAVAIIAGFGLSIGSAITRQGEIYFDSIAMLTALLLGSRHLLKVIQQKTGQSLDRIWAGLPESAWMQVESGSFKLVRSDRIPKGATIKVEAGSVVPIDGHVISGSSHINVAMLTGESSPQSIKPGASILAGTQNLTQCLVIQTDQVQSESRIARLLTQLKDLPKPKWIQRTDRIAQRLLILVMGSSVGLVAWGIATQQLVEGLHRALALLIVTCPCALGVAAPLTVAIRVSRAAKSHILIKNPDVLEKIPHCSPIFLDKTGTLTEGQADVQSVIQTDAFTPLAPAIASALETQSRHPIGLAISRYYASEPLETIDVNKWTETQGVGVFGQVNGETWSIQKCQSPPSERGTWVSLFHQSTAICHYQIVDRLRLDARSTLSQLDVQSVYILSGDRSPAVKQMGIELGFPEANCLGDLSPEDKLAMIQSHPNAMMIGDGANDAPALKAASIGIAVYGSLESSLKSADVVFMAPGLAPLQTLQNLGTETHRVMTRNLRMSLGYNLLFGGLAITGFMSPVLAAVLMPISSVSVIISSIWRSKLESN